MSTHVDLPSPSLFRSFWQAGFESSTHVNRFGRRLDMMAFVQHDDQVESDYGLLRGVDIATARDAVRWHLVDRAGLFDFSSFAPMVEAAQRQGVQVIWDLCHYGWPEDVDPFASDFPDRFARFSRAVAQVVRDSTDDVPFYCPINEISFLAWAGGDVRFMNPFGEGRADELKRQLARAAIAATEAIWSVDARARITVIDPIYHVHAPKDRPDLAARAAGYTEAQFEAWDMIAGRRNPELGGHPKYLDIVGVNFYHGNQWDDVNGRLRWEDEPIDDRWIPLHKLIERAYLRYQRPIFLAETSHIGSGRARWMRDIANEAVAARSIGMPLEGICLYPILDRTDWENDQHWHNSGLWDLVMERDGRFRRVINPTYARAFHASQALLAEHGCGHRPTWQPTSETETTAVPV